MTDGVVLTFGDQKMFSQSFRTMDVLRYVSMNYVSYVWRLRPCLHTYMNTVSNYVRNQMFRRAFVGIGLGALPRITYVS